MMSMIFSRASVAQSLDEPLAGAVSVKTGGPALSIAPECMWAALAVAILSTINS